MKHFYREIALINLLRDRNLKVPFTIFKIQIHSQRNMTPTVDSIYLLNSSSQDNPPGEVLGDCINN